MAELGFFCFNYLLGGAATCSEGFVISFLKVPLACLGNMASAVQPNGLGTFQKSLQNLQNKWPPHPVCASSTQS